MKLFVLIFTLLTAQSVFALQENGEQPLDPHYVGVHGMVLFGNGSTLYASLMPDYEQPHDAQIIYRVFSDSVALNVLVRDADLVTIRPDVFNLERLMRAQSFEHNVDVYMGNYQRDGMLTYEDMALRFDQQVYFRKLENLEKSSKQITYDVVPIKNNARLAVHRIQQAPSFDHIVLLFQDLNCLTSFNASSAVPRESELLAKLSFCGPMKPVYYDSYDFR
ncbi:hypothetical protein [Aestuariibacter salexigens]|uniref:hypothetical protein n=1 Tax=Aestuariibacter salexigens TaxID=226010 RepID=UPI000401566B|nr:hypothetical protein [Aestuariibacter salexigens]